MATYQALERGFVDDHIVEPGEIFTTDAPKGDWMVEVEEAVEEKAPRRQRAAASDE